MGSSSFYAVESARFAVRTVARELVGVSLAMSRADEAERVPPSIRGSIFEISIARELVEPARTGTAVVCPKRVDCVAHADQRRPSLPNSRAVAFSHTQNRDCTEHESHDEHRPDAPEHEQAAQAATAFPGKADPPLTGEASCRGHHW